MGDVWRGEHRLEGVPVAVKFVTSMRATEGDAARFRREVRSAAALNHPGIVRIFDYGEADHDVAAHSGLRVKPGSPYLVMEYADGGSLAAFEAEISWSHLRELLVGLLEALGHAHSRGVIHRDLKPSNILLTSGPQGRRYKISDFGLAFLADDAVGADSSHNRAAGTPYFMAPEQFRSRWRDYGPWTDLYGLGCLAWRLVTGSYPFPGNALLEVAQKHLANPLPEFEPRVPLPDAFEHWLARLLEKHPYNRFRRAADALWPLLQMPRTLEGEGTELDLPETPTIHRTQAAEPLETLADSQRETASFADPHSGDAVAPGSDDPVPRTIEPAERKLPPVPKTWTQETPRDLSMPMIGAGLRLFGLREFPMVDRESERDRLWEALIEVVETGATRLVLLEGAAGVGTSRLARWIRERAEQLGAAVGLAARHDRQGSGGGLTEMIADFLSLDGLDGGEAEERIENWYQARGVDREFEWRALARLVAGSEESPDDDPSPPGPEASNAGEVRAVVRRFLEYAARERPLVVHLDDLHDGLDTLRFLEHVFISGSADETPILFVGTIRDDALAEHELEREIVETLRNLEKSHTLEVGDLSTTDQRLLVEKVLRLTPAAAHEVVQRAGGNPQFAVELVRDWIDRDLLEVTDRGFDLPDDADVPVPDDLFQIWFDRLDGVVSNATEPERAALQLAATLGSEFDETEWRAACDRADLPVPENLLEELLRRSLLEQTDTGWRFPHNMLRETIERCARDAGRWEDLNRHCAAPLRDRDDGDLQTAERLATYLLEAGEREEALEPLLDAVEYWGRRAEYDVAAARHELAREVARDVALNDTDRLALKMQLLEARLHLSRSHRLGRSQQLLRSVIEAAEELDYGELEFEARLALVTLYSQGRSPKKAAEVGERTLERAKGLNLSTIQLGRLHYQLGNASFNRGNLAAASRHFDTAMEHFRRKAPDEFDKTLHRSADVDNHRGDAERAEEKYKRTLRRARSKGNANTFAMVANTLGDLARRSGDYELAAERYRQAEECAHLVMVPELQHVFLGRIQLCIAQNRFDRALELSDERRQLLDPLKDSTRYFLACFSTHAAAGAGDFERMKEELQKAEKHEGTGAIVAPDIAHSFASASRFARGADEEVLANRTGRLAADYWRDLGRPERAEEIEADIPRA